MAEAVKPGYKSSVHKLCTQVEYTSSVYKEGTKAGTSRPMGLTIKAAVCGNKRFLQM